MLATGVGSHPGEDQAAFGEALRVVLGELEEHLPYLPEVPGRGVTAGMVGRTLALVSEIGVDLQPAGWRLAGPSESSGVDHRRARSLLNQDLDGLEELVQGHAGPIKVQVAGPWTLAATVERPRGDRVLADHGARRDLAQALAEGLREHVADLRRRVPGATRLVVQVDEPSLPAVLEGRVPTASGFGRHRTVHPPEASDALGWVLDAVRAAGAEPWVHSCAPGTPLGLVRGAGADGLVVDLDVVDAAGHDALAESLDAGGSVVVGVVPTGGTPPDDGDVVRRVEQWLDMLGLDPEVLGDRLGLSPACGLAGAGPADARAALAACARAASSLS